MSSGLSCAASGCSSAYLLAGLICVHLHHHDSRSRWRRGGSPVFALWPFGRTVVNRPTAGAPSFIGNVIWFVFAGLWLAIGHLVTGVALMITIIGIPLALANFKLIPISLAPLGKEIVELHGPGRASTVS